MRVKMRPYIPASWFHRLGILKILSKLLPRLPDVNGCLFITLTIDPKLFGSPESGYDYTRDQIRRVFHKLRKGVMWQGKLVQLDVPYFVKTEFQKNGWAHFHIIFLTRRYLPAGLLRQLWPSGRTNVKRIKNKKFHYLLKYVTKGGKAPDWVLKRKRIRIIQASRGFYIDDGQKQGSEPTGRNTEVHRKHTETIGKRLERWEKMVLIERPDGTFTTADLPIPYTEFLNRHVLTIAHAGLYLGNQIINLHEKVIQIWKTEILNQNAGSSCAEWLSPVPTD